jgi:hypothetical protein
LSTNVLFNTQEIECWIKDEQSENGRREMVRESEKRKQAKDDEDTRHEIGKKRRKVKEAKKRDLLALLEGM